MSPLVSVAELVDDLRAGRAPRLLDVRWRLDRPEGRPDYLDGHLPGAVHVDLERELCAPGRPERGRHPLPEPTDLTASVRRWGVGEGDRVVVYDDNASVPAARAWWVLRRHGVDVRVLDGGFRAWLAAGLRLEGGDRAVRRSRLTLAPVPDDVGVASIDEAARAPGGGVLVDVRAPQHYRGQVPGLDPAAGHIPGAINVPTTVHIGDDGLLRSADEIRLTLAAHGIVPGVQTVLYCSSGIPSAHSALAFAVAGVDHRIFPGGWSQWTRDAGRPIAVGPTPDAVIAVV